MARLLSKDALVALALLLVALATRAIFDKLLAVSADWTVVGRYAQAQSLFDLTVGVSLAGLGAGVTVFAARSERPAPELMRAALVWGLIVSGFTAALLIAASPWLNTIAGRELAPEGALAGVAVASGLCAIVPGLASAFWQGRRERGKMLVLTLAGWAPMALAAFGLLGAVDLSTLLWTQLATSAALALALAAPWLRGMRGSAPENSWRNSELRRYILAGVSIGVLSPASVLWSRAELAHALSWNEVAQLQALWRANEWVTGIAGGLLGLVFLPRMAAAVNHEGFHRELARVWKLLCLPAALVLAAFWAGQNYIMPLLYTDAFIMSSTASALFIAGDALRLASWVPLQGLFATERTTAIAIGEWLSLPLFALLLTCIPHLSLETTGACYAFTYFVYLVFNSWCVLRVPPRYARLELEPSAE